MNEIIMKLGNEFERMEKTIDAQKKIINHLTPPITMVPWGATIPQNPFFRTAIPKLKLNDCSWGEITMYAHSGMARERFALGDTKTVTLTDGTTIHVRIIGFNHDDAESGGKLPITFEMVETLNEDCQMNDTITNKGGWEKSCLRSKLNNHVFAHLLPDDLKAVIHPCVKQTRADGAKDASLSETIDKLFVLSEQELYGRTFYSGGKEGRWYDWYKQEYISYVKRKQNGERDWRWLRSPRSGYNISFCSVISDGTANYNDANYSNGVSFGFCV